MISLCDDLSQVCTTHKLHFVSFYNNMNNNNNTSLRIISCVFCIVSYVQEHISIMFKCTLMKFKIILK